jgi:UDPglucose 6-dehydrogenase
MRTLYSEWIFSMRIGVVGYGIVGRAIAYGFRLKGRRVYINDPFLTARRFYEKDVLMRECDLVFVCVQTPMKPDGNMDLVPLERAVTELSDSAPDLGRHKKPNAVVVIKSTVIPGTTIKFASQFPNLKFAANPEFLRATHARRDFLHQRRIVIGSFDERITKKVAEAYEGWECPIVATDPTTAETVKLLSNCFLTLKVAYACEAARICEVLGVNAKEVMDIVCMDPRIGTSHLDPTLGKLPRNSMCLPKDTSALIQDLESRGHSPQLIKTAYAIGVEKETS